MDRPKESMSGLFLGLVYVLLELVLRLREDLPVDMPWIRCPVYPWGVDQADRDQVEQASLMLVERRQAIE